MTFKPLLFLFITFLFFLPFFIFSQTVEWSSPLNASGRYSYWKILGQDDDGFFLLKSNVPLESNQTYYGFTSRKYSVAYFNERLSLVWEKNIVPFKKSHELEKVIWLKDRVVIVSSYINRDKKTITFYAQYLDSKGICQDTLIKIFEAGYKKKNDINDIQYAVSHNRALIAFFYSYKNEEKEDTAAGVLKIATAILSDTLSVLSSRHISLPYLYDTMSISRFAVTDNYGIVLLGKKEEEKYAPYSLFFFNDSGKLMEHNIITGNIIVTNEHLIVDDKNDNVLLTGFYSFQTENTAAGIFYTSVKTTAAGYDTQRVKLTVWDDKFLNDFIGEPKTNGNKELMYYNMERIILRNDGGAVIISEANYTTNYTYYDVFTRTYMTQIIYHYTDIPVLCVDADGKICWTHIIHKNQESVEDKGFYSSYCSAAYLNQIRFLYNRFDGRNNEVVLTSVNHKGEEQTKILFPFSDEVVCIAKAAAQIDDNILIVPAYRKKELYLLRLKF